MVKILQKCKTCKINDIDPSRSICKCSGCLDKSKECTSKYRKKNQAKIKIRSHKYYISNKDTINKKNKEYISSHPEKEKEYSRKYYLKAIDKIKEYNLKNRKSINTSKIKWAKENVERVRKIRQGIYLRRKDKASDEWRKYRARKLNAEGSFTQKEWLELLSKYDNRCLQCGSMVKLEADHVVPLSMGGGNSIDNIQPLCRKDNRSKFTKTLDFRPFGSAILDWT